MLWFLGITCLCLAPGISLAEEPPAAPEPIVVSAECEIIGALAEDAPSSTLPDGTEGGPIAKGTPSARSRTGASACARPSRIRRPSLSRSPPIRRRRSLRPRPRRSRQRPPSSRRRKPRFSRSPKPPPLRRPHRRRSRRRRSSPRADTSAPQDDTSGERKPAKLRGHVRIETNLRAHVVRRKRARKQTPAEFVLPGPETPVLFVTDEPVIPRFLIGLYKEAGKRYHIPWPILAAINEIETDFGRNVAVSSAGADGWMQFMPATWRAYGVDADHDGVKDPDNPRDAIFAAARYLYASGAPINMRRAIFAYNHAGWYVDSVLLRAERIAAPGRAQQDAQAPAEVRRAPARAPGARDQRITLYPCGREDIKADRIDRRVLIVLRFLAWSGLHPTVTSLECGHCTYTKSGNVSQHSTARPWTSPRSTASRSWATRARARSPRRRSASC